MEIFAPRYYHDFVCIASACPDSCCKDWTVDVDNASVNYYRTLPGALGDRLRAVLKTEDDSTVMTITDGRCPMWRQDGLCEIQAQLGHDALCQTCRDFPRLHHDYGSFVELGLELSCPEAARLILQASSFAMTSQVISGGTEAEYDTEIMEILRRSRSEVLSFLESSAYPLPHTLAIIFLYAHSVQNEIDGGERVCFDPEACLADARYYSAFGSIDNLFELFKGLEILTPQWKMRLNSSPVNRVWPNELCALAGYFIQRYWFQAVADYDLVGRVKLTLAACLLVNALGGDVIETAQLFSKEIENNPENIVSILDAAYISPALTDVNLLSLLMC